MCHFNCYISITDMSENPNSRMDAPNSVKITEPFIVLFESIDKAMTGCPLNNITLHND
ncbi:hypothetical protein NUKP16_10610 [Klebsiella quasipneumoniae]|nr:hypothetical protein NUKP16_10610 [Klebsiella quasipneumoniae]